MEIEENKIVQISHDGQAISGKINIGGSKSISNRVLLLNALSRKSEAIYNLSESMDTVCLQNLLQSESSVLDAHHAGTTFRFMTAYLALREGEQILTGSDRMKQRPIGPLVDALVNIGADIEYVETEGFPPLKIKSFNAQKDTVVNVKADISSQFLSALCMIAPTLEKGLTIKFVGELVSEPYLLMTLNLMKQFGVESIYENQSIKIESQNYRPIEYTVESDWSSASYYYSIAAIATSANIELKFFKAESLQGDSRVGEIYQHFGIESKIENGLLRITSNAESSNSLSLDFIRCPDIAQTIAVTAGAKGIELFYSGLKTLYIKETDRVAALQNELAKIGVMLIPDSSGRVEFRQEGIAQSVDVIFETYQDHRMAMAFAPLALLMPVKIKNPKVVEKSYPSFWKDLVTLGFSIKEINDA